MAIDISSRVDSIPDRQPASVTLIDQNGGRIHLDCIFNQSTSPSFILLFPSGALPPAIENTWRCILVSKDITGAPVTFAAKIKGLPNGRVIEAIAQDSIRPEDLRDYFRVNLKAPIDIFYDPIESDRAVQPFEISGETVDISQSGVLSILEAECKISQIVSIELDLPNPAETIICSGKMVRCKRIRKNRWLTAFHFESISPKAREIVAKNCFSEQRRQLRENIQTAG